MQTADQSKKGPDPTAPPPYPGVGQTGSYAGGFVAPPVGPGYDGAPPQQGYPPQNPGYPAAGGVSNNKVQGFIFSLLRRFIFHTTVSAKWNDTFSSNCQTT